jgi:hypothetical protein
MQKTWGSFIAPRKGASRQRWKDPVLVDMRVKFHAHKANAKGRSIPFLLSFDQWQTLWLDSGKWSQRGPRQGQYVMARNGDSGPYAVGNVRICPVEENHAERPPNSCPGERNGGFGKNYWAQHDADTRDARRQAVSLKMKGRPKSSDMRSALSKTVTGRKWVIRDGRRTWAYRGDSDFPVATF